MCTRILVATFLLTSAVRAVPQVLQDVSVEPEGFVDDDGLDIRDRYIVTLHPGADLEQHIDQAHTQTLFGRQIGPSGFQGITHTYNFAEFQAYAGHFESDLVQSLQNRTDVLHIEPDQLWRTAGLLMEQSAPDWGLSSISHKAIPTQADDTYFYDTSAGDGTHAYVVDSGIMISHDEFEGRAKRGFNAVRPSSKHFNDISGHGTHVAGIIGSKTYGVAKRCNLIAVKVISKESSSLSKILDGFEWSVNDVLQQRRKTRAVINVSVWGPRSEAFNLAVDTASTKGITTVCAAGNNKLDAAEKSPASAKTCVTVSAADQTRAASEFGNWGHAVDLYAPGVDIKSTWIGGNSAVQTYSGTSQASAYVAGLVVYFKRLYNLPDSKSTTMALMGNSAHDSVTQRKGPKVPFVYNGSGK